MSDTLVLVLVIVGAVIVIVLVAWLWVRVSTRRRVAAMGPQERELFEAQRQYEAAVEKAEKTLDIAEQTWMKRVKAAEQAVTEANSIGTRSIGSYRKVKVFEDHVETSSGAFSFENGPVEATVDTASSLMASKQAALSRAGQEVMRRLTDSTLKPEHAKTPYLLVETPVFVDVTEGKTDDDAKLRQFALSMNNASRSMDRIRGIRTETVASADEALTFTRAEAERTIAAAQQELDKVKSNNSRLDAAKAALARLHQPASSSPSDGPPQNASGETQVGPSFEAGISGEPPTPAGDGEGRPAGTASAGEGTSLPREG